MHLALRQGTLIEHAFIHVWLLQVKEQFELKVLDLKWVAGMSTNAIFWCCCHAWQRSQG
jgi:hypothetical protein